jgi:hypothetical protein
MYGCNSVSRDVFPRSSKVGAIQFVDSLLISKADNVHVSDNPYVYKHRQYYVRVKESYPCTSNMVLYGCEAWSFASRAEHRLSVFENSTLGKIFGTKLEDLTGGLEETA